MATINRLKNKKRSFESAIESSHKQTPTSAATGSRSKIFSHSSHTQEKQAVYQQYYEISQCNPIGVQATSSLFPHNISLYSQYHCPLGFTLSPMIMMDNECEVMEKSADKIPRCGTCRAYMNCYNRIEKKTYFCFYCGRENLLDGYNHLQTPNNEMNSSIYQALGPTNFYKNAPPEESFVFLIDISPQAARSKMIYYAVAAMKEVLARPDLDETVIHFFTYDTFVQEYDFSGKQIKCTIMDQSFSQPISEIRTNLLGQIRENLFKLLDQLEEVSSSNTRNGSNLINSLAFVYNYLKTASPKFFILQSNDGLIGEEWIAEGAKSKNNVNNSAPKSILESRNKKFFDAYVSDMLTNSVSIAMFVFSRNFKNMRVFGDTFKLTNSQLNYYNKDSGPEIDKFYYDFSYLLGCTYFNNVHTEFIACQGWHYTAIYGNFYRIKENITFKINYVDPSRKFICLLSPSKSAIEPNPCCAIQLVVNYRYKRQDILEVINIVQPVTGYLNRLYQSIDQPTSICGLSKGFFSSLRMENINIARKKMTQISSQIYLAAVDYFKNKDKIPDTIIGILQSALAMLKSTHAQIDSNFDSPIFDKIVSERNYLQFCGPNQIINFFCPYLFDLSNLESNMCLEQNFIYPPTIEAKFMNIREGLFMLDNGLSLYLFIAKKCNPQLLKQAFGKQTLAKNDLLTEQVLTENETILSYQIQMLVRTLREQHSYGWKPLFIVRCSQNTNNERNFYLNFYAEKYDEFRSYKFSLEEYIAMVSRPGSF